MKRHVEFKTSGTCSRMVIIDLDGDIIENCSFVGGCSGNTAGVCALVKGMTAADAINKLKGIKCGFKQTSCPDQLAKALEGALNQV